MTDEDWQERAMKAEKSLSQLRYDTAPLIVQAKELLDQGRVAEGGMLWIARDDIIRLAANHPESK